MTETGSKHLRVLVVEDEASIANLVRIALSSDGCQVETTNTGEAAIDMWRVGHHDLLILDLRLAGEMDGIDVYQVIRRIKGAAPRAIVMSAATEAPALARALGLPILVKPFSVTELRTTARRVLEEPAPPRWLSPEAMREPRGPETRRDKSR